MYGNKILLINLHPKISELSTGNALIRIKKDSVRQRYNKIIANIGGKGVSDQCQQETFHDFLFQVIDIRSLI